MTPTLQQTSQRTFEDLLQQKTNPAPEHREPAGEVFVSPVANIPTNRTPLTPTHKPT